MGAGGTHWRGFSRRLFMSAASAPSAASPGNPEHPAGSAGASSSVSGGAGSTSEHAAAPPSPRWPWLKYVTPLIVLLLAVAIIVTVTRDWNAWEGGHAEQVTDDAYVRGDLTPLSTKVPGIVKEVK